MATKLLAALAVAASAAESDVSREGKSFSSVFVITAPGVTYPMVNFGLAANEANEPEYPGHLTPLGQRQHYLIGSELRKRYVDES